MSSSQRRGKYFFDKYCVVCHGKSGEGDGFNSYNLIPKPKDLSDSLYGIGNSDSFLNQIISLGGRGVNRSSHKPGYQYTLEEEEIQYVIDYLRTLSSMQK